MKKRTLLLIISIFSALALILTACKPTDVDGFDDFTVTFIVDNTAVDEISTIDALVEMPAIPSKENFTFDGWFLDKDVWAEEFDADYLLENTVTQNIIVYAKWLSNDIPTEGLAFTLINGDAEYSVSIGTATDVEITIPATYNAKPVTTIAEQGFNDSVNITSITIPSSITTIEDHAFSTCQSLTSLTIPNGVLTIGEGAFQGCSSLISITIPDSVTSLGIWAFYYCTSLTTVSLPASINSIGEGYFFDCNSLTIIDIPASIILIGDSAFQNCSSLVSIEIPGSVDSIGEEAFYNCTALTTITTHEGLESIGPYAFQNCSVLDRITIPDSVTSIGAAAFYQCSELDIYARAAGRPEGWAVNWNPDPRPVNWSA